MKWLTALFALFILFIIVQADRGQLGIFKEVNQIPYGDKVGHFGLYGLLAFLLASTCFLIWPAQPPLGLAIISGLFLSILIGIEENSQKYFSGRTYSTQDLIASYLGVLFFSWLALRAKK